MPGRHCVTGKGFDNCGSCMDFVCDKLKSRIVERRELEKKLNRELTDKEYELFVRPYESKARLQKIRKAGSQIP